MLVEISSSILISYLAKNHPGTKQIFLMEHDLLQKISPIFSNFFFEQVSADDKAFFFPENINVKKGSKSENFREGGDMKITFHVSTPLRVPSCHNSKIFSRNFAKQGWQGPSTAKR